MRHFTITLKKICTYWVLLLLLCGHISASEVELPDFPSEASLLNSVSVVFVPDDLVLAKSLIHRYNALLNQSQLRVPRIDQITTFAVRGDQIWLPTLVQPSAEYFFEHPEIGFTFFNDQRFTGCYQILVPNAVIQDRLQRFIDEMCLAENMEIPRPRIVDEINATPSSTFNKFWSTSGFAQFTWGNYLVITISFFIIAISTLKQIQPFFLIPFSISAISINCISPAFAAPLQNIYGLLTGNGIISLLLFSALGFLINLRILLSKPVALLIATGLQIGIIIISYFAFSTSYPYLVLLLGTDPFTALYVGFILESEYIAALSILVAILFVTIPRLHFALAKKSSSEIHQVSRLRFLIVILTVLLLVVFLLPHALIILGPFLIGNLVRESSCENQYARRYALGISYLLLFMLGLCLGTQLNAASLMNERSLSFLLFGSTSIIITLIFTFGATFLLRKLSGGRIDLIGLTWLAYQDHSENDNNSVNLNNPLTIVGPFAFISLGSAIYFGVLSLLLPL